MNELYFATTDKVREFFEEKNLIDVPYKFAKK